MKESAPKSRIPAEWEPQTAVWLTWPSAPTWWAGAREASLVDFAKLAAVASEFETVRINCPKDSDDKSDGAFSGREDAAARIERAGGNLANVEFYDHPTNDVWCRDSGCVFGIAPNGTLKAIDFAYNSWGGKFPPWNLDDELAEKMRRAAKAEPSPCREIFCEGGALEFDGLGTMLTTECVLLNANRNPSLTKKRAEEIFADLCGVEKIIWLKDGLWGDDTDGHIDNIARFAPEGKILAAVCAKENPSYQSLSENLDVLKSATNARGEKFEVVELPLPDAPVKAKYPDGSERVLPASYANYLVLNSAVLVPAYGQNSDERAAKIIADAFAQRRIIPVESSVFLREGGAVHCLTQHQPAVK